MTRSIIQQFWYRLPHWKEETYRLGTLDPPARILYWDREQGVWSVSDFYWSETRQELDTYDITFAALKQVEVRLASVILP